MASHVKEECEPDVWYVAQAAATTCVVISPFFSHLNEDFHSSISFGDHSTVKVMGKGEIKIGTKNGFEETISNVFYVPDLKCNLLSAGQLQKKGYIITIRKGACEI